MTNPLRAFREALKLSRSELAAAIGKSPQTLEKYEAEAPESLIAELVAYARSIGREDTIDLLVPSAKVSSTVSTGASIPDFDQSAIESLLHEVGRSPTAEEMVWLRKFMYLQQHGDPETRDAINRNVDRFTLLTRVINGEPEAQDEIDRLARQIASDPKRRVEFLRDLDQRYPPRGKSAEPHEGRTPEKTRRDPPKTGTGGKH